MSGAERTLYLIDATSYVYRAFFALPRLTNPKGEPVQAVFGFAKMLLKFLRQVEPKYAAAVFDAPGRTFRDDLFEHYKATRPPTPNELVAQLPLVREVVEGVGLPLVMISGVEADDVIASLASRWVEQGGEVIIVSGDKDLLQLVDGGVRVWDTMYDRWYNAAEVEKKFGIRPEQVPDFIALVGDSVDNIPGVKGIGEKTAQILLRRFGSLENILANVDKVAESREIRGARNVAAALRAQASTAQLGYELARVRRDVPLALTEEDLAVRSLDFERLRPLFLHLGFYSLLRELPRPAAAVEPAHRAAEEPSQVGAYLEEARSAGLLACASTRSENELTVVLARPDGVVLVVPASVLAPRDLLERALNLRATRLVAHDLKRDLRQTSAEECPTAGAFDVMVAAYLLEAPAPAALENVAEFYLGQRLPHFRTDVPSTVAGVTALVPLESVLRGLLVKHGMATLFEQVEAPLVGVLARMEAAGVHVDTEALRAVGEELSRRMENLTREIYELAGTEFNIASPQQLREVLFERLRLPTRGIRRGKTGLSTDVDVLTRLASLHPLPAKILEYRSVAKLHSTYVEGLLAAVDPRTGRLHTTFNQCVTATGRLSSTEPNLQNIPVRGEEGMLIRQCFTAPPGHKLVVADYSQIELRLLAHFSEDPVLCASFHNNEDVHARTAAEVFGIDAASVTRDQRRVAKMINFGVLYGMGAASLAKELGIPVSEAQHYIDQYFTRYARVRQYLDQVVETARQRGFVTTLLGRRRSVPELASPDRAAAQAAERIAFNTPIQGSAADIIKLAMVQLDDAIRQRQLAARMTLQVHDELVFEVAESDVEAMQSLARSVMESVVRLRVPLVVDIGVGSNWAAAHR